MPVAMPECGYAYLPVAGVPFSSGVVALDGYVLRRLRLRRPLPLAEGLEFSARFLQSQDRTPAAMAGCELRIPARLTRAGFAAFNADYLAALQSHGFTAGEVSPLARTNMAPQFDAPPAAVLAAFTFAVPRTVREPAAGPDFLISGMPEFASNPPRVAAPGDVSPAGMKQKAEIVIGELRRRVTALGAEWSNITGVQIYTRHSLEAVMDLLGRNGLAGSGLSLIPGDPPSLGPGDIPFEFEMDVRSIAMEENISG